jgi:hypothetical protein
MMLTSKKCFFGGISFYPSHQNTFKREEMNMDKLEIYKLAWHEIVNRTVSELQQQDGIIKSQRLMMLKEKENWLHAQIVKMEEQS